MRKRLLTIIAFVLGIIIFGGATGVVAYGMGANQIGFTPKDSAWKVNSVNEAIDDLYIKKAGENYSTEERVVGTWIDGKPLYQKTILFDNVNTSSWKEIVEIQDISVKKFTGSGYNDTLTYPLPYRGMAAYIIFKYDTGKLYYMTSTGSAAIGVLHCELTIQYTKTTDEAPSQNNQG